MATVLSTKRLGPAQRERCLNAGLGLVEYNALEIGFLPVAIPLDRTELIFTSQNAVKAFLDRTQGLDRSRYNAYCVGEKTAGMLQEHGLRVMAHFDYASQLGPYIVERHPEKDFLFLCGRQRRELLPELFRERGIHCEELTVYSSRPNPRAFSREFDGILCFSPLGIQSHLLENRPGNSLLFCIGETTAEEARKHSKHILIAKRPTIDHVLALAINHFKHD